MELVTPQFLRALTYSHTPIDRVNAWRGGQLVKDNLTVASGEITISGGNNQVITSSLKLTVVDETGELIPETMGDALAPFGTELQVKMGVELGQKTELVDMGWYTLISTEIDEYSDFRKRPAEPDPIWFSKGALLSLECSDRMYNLEKDKFTSRQQPQSTSVFAETNKLLDANRPAYGGVIGSVSDKTIPSDLTYDTDRIKAILDLASVVNADVMIDSKGLLRHLSRVKTGPVWRLEKGTFSVLSSTKRKISRDGIYNGAVESSSANNDRPIQATKFTSDGPLQWGGPFGRVPLLHSSPLLTTQDQVNAGVNTLYNRAILVNPQDIPIECVRNPALRWGDQIELPTRTGYVIATIKSITFPFGYETMKMVVSADPFSLRGLI